MVNAMNYCHRKDMVHRDLKLENLLLVSPDSNVIRVCDFGIAGGSSNLKAEDIDAGSLCYMAPEVLLG
jgi:serine/threonine protein kinase